MMFSKPNLPSGAFPMSVEVAEHTLRRAVDRADLDETARQDLHYTLTALIEEARRRGKH